MKETDNHLCEDGDKLICVLTNIIQHIVRILAVLMTIVIVFCVIDVGVVMYKKLIHSNYFLLELSDIFVIFASFLAVLIAIEIFINITLYLRDDVIHIKLVVATALMAIARKVIVLDFTSIEHEYLLGIAAIVISLGFTYFLVSLKART
ncbi:phosphate-starvation-inducible PsiE family protein [Agaribacter flavus]|jgi:uncharacterized membrane protein (DUF373 family)|uniref:Phosphate-starvation-inducible PsiE family protein n=1 Tax=Agaribacter flavus TaxID=1902781 RepID=A0ABV7FR53_9ALTE